MGCIAGGLRSLCIFVTNDDQDVLDELCGHVEETQGHGDTNTVD